MATDATRRFLAGPCRMRRSEQVVAEQRESLLDALLVELRRKLLVVRGLLSPATQVRQEQLESVVEARAGGVVACVGLGREPWLKNVSDDVL